MLRVVAAVGLVGLLLAALSNRAAEGSGAQPLALDRIELDERGGQVAVTRREPLVALDRSGRGHRWHRGERRGLRVSPEVFEALLDFVVREQGFFEIDAEAIQDEIHREARARGEHSKVMDASTTTVRVVAGGREHAVSFYAARFHARAYPDVDALQRFASIADKIRALGEEPD
jgi:hypothetical protein